MGLKQYKPTSAGTRTKLVPDYSELKSDQPVRKQKIKKKKVKSLKVSIHKSSGRNSQGKITSRFRGGGHKKIYRLIDFLRSDKEGIPSKVDFIDYDPNRNCWIALLIYRDGEKRYIIAPENLKSADEVISGPKAPINVGNALPLINIPLGSTVHNIELYPNRGGQLVRSAGQSAQLIAKEKGLAGLRLPSGEMRWVLDNCYATLGRVSNSEWANQSSGKAGRKRWKGRKPRNRGVSMNPVDHKHGGGEGRCPVGAPGAFTAFGKPHGLKTRKRRKNSNKFIISSRKKKGK
ncbi:MAG: 50S ribosomal protein L2 [Candidatus Caenarcaniphilales bacterium]|nr:50S ribosomal protein L2 [Candidatus Caenarcaniphilales bacterium]